MKWVKTTTKKNLKFRGYGITFCDQVTSKSFIERFQFVSKIAKP